MRARAFVPAVFAALLAGSASASWYWPFATNATDSAKGPRLSELMEPASLAIDEAADLIADGKMDEASEKYREALRVLEKLETDNPERAASPEFQSVRTKRAYVDAQLNAILLKQARLNAKAVAVTDTTDLEEKIRKKRADEAAARGDGAAGAGSAGRTPRLESELDDYMEGVRTRARTISRAAASARFERESEEQIAALLKKDPASRKARILRAGLELHRKNYAVARRQLEEFLERNPSDLSALNLLAAVEAASGDGKAAEATLVRAIRADRGDYHAYYNLAKILLRRGDGKSRSRAKTLYESGRKPKDAGGPGGPVDPPLEREFK